MHKIYQDLVLLDLLLLDDFDGTGDICDLVGSLPDRAERTLA
jgi:hypothetical protein